jgi:uncharacterized protein YjdB/fibronectin type 3 domain-containing protein
LFRLFSKRLTAAGLSLVLLFSLFTFGEPATNRVFGAASNLVANPDFEQDGKPALIPAGWQVHTTDGTVATQTGGSSGNYSAKLTSSKRTGSFSSPSAGLYQVHTNLEQGTYTLSVKIRTSTPNPSNATQQQSAFLEAKDTGSPDMRAFVNLFAMNTTDWNHVVLRNVLVYNGQATIGIYLQNADVGATLEVDEFQFYMEHSDHNPLMNWGFESGNTANWITAGEVKAVTGHADAGTYAAQLDRGAKIAQTVAVKPNTDYVATVRGKVGGSQDRLKIGVEGIQENRSAPSATTEYTLLPVAFRTGPNETSATIYVERTTDGSGLGYADSIDLFEIDNTIIKGVDVSFLLIVEDYGGKYTANGVEQDFFDIIRNRGVNAVTSMFFVEAGNYVYDEQQWKDYQAGIRGDLPKQSYDITYMNDFAHLGTISAPLQMIPGYFGKDQALEIGKRAKQQHMNFEVSFHYSDTWMSQAKAWKPLSWFGQNIQQLQTTMYNYTYDFIKTLVDEGVAPHSVKLGNEENSGIVWPEGRIYSNDRVGFAKLVNASYQAVKAASPSTRGFLHLNNGYDVASTNTWYDRNEQNGIEWDGEAYSLYGGREIGSIISMLNNNLHRWKGRDVVFSETALAHTRENLSPVASGSAMSNKYYEVSQRGQYNWLIEYMQAFRDVPNPYGSEIGFFYWAAEWISKGQGHNEWYSPWIPGGSTSEYGNTIDKRTLFTYDGHASDGLYAYLWRGKASSKPLSGKLSHSEVSSTYAVEPTRVTGVELAANDLNLTVGFSEKIVPTVKPIDQFTYTNINWTTSDSSVAAVNGSGVVTGMKAGEATVTATTKDGGFTATRKVVVAPPVLAGNILLAAPVLDVNQSISGIVGDRIKIQTGLSNKPSDNRLIYTSSNPEVASFLGEAAEKKLPGVLYQQLGVTTDVTLQVHRDGETTITIKSADGAAEKSFVLNASKIAVTGVRIEENNLDLGIGRTRQLSAVVSPQNASFPSVSWKSSDPVIAEVDATGLVKAVAEGKATITVTTGEGSLTDTVEMNVVPVRTESIALDVNLIRLRSGDTLTVNASVLPADAANQSLLWQSSDPDVITVENGVVTAVADGHASLTVRAVDGGASQVVEAIVADNLPVTGVDLDQTLVSLVAGEYRKLQAQIKPAAADNQKVTWSSSDHAVATVTEDGYVVAHSKGTATITVTTTDGDYEAEAVIAVDDQLQKGKTTNASRIRAANPVALAIDGLVSTAWTPGAGRANQTDSWWIDLGKLAKLDQIDMEFWGAQKYAIEISDDGVSYTQVVNQIATFSSSNKVSHSLPADTMGRYVKVVVHEASQAGGTTWPSIVEFSARGKFVTKAESLALTETAKTVVMSDSFNLSAALQPSFIDEPIEWTSSDSSLAEIVSDGARATVITKAHGGEGGEIRQATITARTPSGLTSSAVISIKAPIFVEDIGMYRKDQVNIPDDKKVIAMKGATLELGVTVFQGDADHKPIYWKSDNEDVATVDRLTGVVTTHQQGRAQITVVVNSYDNLTGGMIFEDSIELSVVGQPEAPVNLTAEASGLAIGLDWESVETATGYKVYRSVSDGLFELLTVVPVVKPGYNDTALTANTKYSYQVTALNAAGESLKSAIVEATTEAVAVAPSTPEGVTATAHTSNSITLGWDAAVGATTYNVYRSLSEDGDYEQINTTEVLFAEFEDQGLNPATTYYYKVEALNEAGTSALSSAASAATLTAEPEEAPSTPEELAASTGNTSSVELSWKAVEEASGYNIYRASALDGNFAKITAQPLVDSKYIDAGLAPGSSYYYKVSAVNANGESDLSTAVRGRTSSVVDPGPTPEPTTPVTTPSPSPVPTGKDKITSTDGKLDIKADKAENGSINIKLTEQTMNDVLAKTTGSTLRIQASWMNENTSTITLNLPLQPLRDALKQIDSIVFEAAGAVWTLDYEELRHLTTKDDNQFALSLILATAGALAEVVSEQPVYEYKASIDGRNLSELEISHLAKVGLPYILSNGEKAHQVVVFHITADGKLEVVKKAIYDAQTGRMTFTPNKEGRYVTANVKAAFDDLGEAKWAVQAIETLAARGLVSGTDARLFQPNQAVTRAQFLHMLMNAMDLAHDYSVSSFTDVDQQAWYAKSIAAAEQLGILKGRADGTFDGQAFITREEMAVFVYRAAGVLQLLPDAPEAKRFTDASEISSHAVKAVDAIRAMGIIQGSGSGQFQPKQLATRGQAAQIMFKLLMID